MPTRFYFATVIGKGGKLAEKRGTYPRNPSKRSESLFLNETGGIGEWGR
jgi:hypothetical protein